MTGLYHRRNMPARRRNVALLGIFAVLLQAFLMAVHRHPLPAYRAGEPVSLYAQHSATPLSPAAAEDNCPICFTLQHVGNAPVDFAGLPPLRRRIAAPLFFETPSAQARPPAGFHPRAPPAA